MENEEYQLIESTVKQTLSNIHTHPDRTLLELIDMALRFAREGRFEHTFFSAAKHMLEDMRSSYYSLITDAAMNIDTERMLRFGMNLGYNSCVLGSKIIRETEKKYHFSIPWNLSLIIDSNRFYKLEDYYHELIYQANSLGIYMFLIRVKGRAQSVLPFVAAHGNSAFILFCDAEDITSSLIDMSADLLHIMIAVRLSRHADAACAMLRNNKYIYALEIPYGIANAESILNGTVYKTAQMLHPAFTLFTPESSCPKSVSHRIYTNIRQARENQSYATIPIETVHDIRTINNVISSKACTACFDESGMLWIQPSQPLRNVGSIFSRPLFDILRESLPKI